MRTITTILLCISMIFTVTTVNAFDISEIKPDDSFIRSLDRNIEDDIRYLENIANLYSGKYIVNREQYIDCQSIDDLFNGLSAPITLEEIDNSNSNFNLNDITVKSEYKNKLVQFKVLGGLCGYKAEFEPTAFFHIHRDISLIGGYINYTKTYVNPDYAYWQYVCSVEALTKEVIPYDTRLRLLNEMRELNSFIDGDKTFKIFLLKDGKVDGLFLRDSMQLNVVQTP